MTDPSNSTYNLRNGRIIVCSDDTDDDYDPAESSVVEVDEESTEAIRANPKGRKARAKSTGRHREVKKRKAGEDPEEVLLQTMPTAVWSEPAVRALLRHCEHSLKHRGSIAADVIRSELAVDGYKYSKDQVINKLGNHRIDGKTIMQHLQQDGAVVPPIVLKSSILDEVLSKMSKAAHEQANYGESRKGEATHLQSALKRGFDMKTYTFSPPDPVVVSPVILPASSSMEPTYVSSGEQGSRSSSPTRPRSNIVPIPLVTENSVTLRSFGRGRIDCLSYLWSLDQTLVLVATVGANDTVLFEFSRTDDRQAVVVTVMRSLQSSLAVVSKSKTAWLKGSFALPVTWSAFTGPSAPLVFKVYLPNLPFQEGPNEVVEEPIDAGRKIAACLIVFDSQS